MAAIFQLLCYRATNLLWNLTKKPNFLIQVYLFFIVSRGMRMVSIAELFS